MFRTRCLSSSVSLLTASVACCSSSPSGPFVLASIGLTRTAPLFSLVSSFRCSSASTTARTAISNSPRGPGISMGRTIPSRFLDCSILIFSELRISRIASLARSSASPSGPRFDSSKSFGRRTIFFDRSLSDRRMLSTKSTTRFSITPSGPSCSMLPGPPDTASMGRTRIPPRRTISLALLPSSSMTCWSHSTLSFSHNPSGPMVFSLASIGLTYEASSPIMRARLSSTRRSASRSLKKPTLHS
mmetsp:Transcript_17515/g.36018  ORF Transcript_17515/g.36018 Transcript_17515/m.36018 type:complete len:244 (+) Transcript_17515:1244-1975(+)